MTSCLRPVMAAFAWVRDRCADLLGASYVDARQQMGTFAGVAAVLFAAVLLSPPGWSFGAASAALFLLLMVYFKWGANEGQRGRIAKKVEDPPREPLPDLRWLALFAAVAITALLPLLLSTAQAAFAPFVLKRVPSYFEWLWFLLDKTYLRALPDTVDLWFARIEQTHGNIVDYRPGDWQGRGLVFVAYLVVGATLVQAAIRLWQIDRDIKEGVLGVARDPDMAVRLGRRAVPRLMAEWGMPQAEEETRANIAEALGKIGDAAALPLLREAARGHAQPAVQAAALLALADLGNANGSPAFRKDVSRLLGEALRNGSETSAARVAAAAGLGVLECDGAIFPLLEKLEESREVDSRHRKGGEDPNIRKETVRAVGLHLGRRRKRGDPAAPPLIERAVATMLAGENSSSLLEDLFLRVRNKTAGALAELGDPRAVGPLVDRLRDPHYQNPKLIADTAAALGGLLGALAERPALAVEALREKLDSPNDSVQQAAARALGSSGAVHMLPELVRRFEAAVRDGHEDLAAALRTGACGLRPEAKAQLEDTEQRLGRHWSQRRRRALLDRDRPEAERVEAAAKLAEYGDRRGLPALRRAVADPNTPAAVREACRAALAVLAPEETKAATEGGPA